MEGKGAMNRNRTETCNSSIICELAVTFISSKRASPTLLRFGAYLELFQSMNRWVRSNLKMQLFYTAVVAESIYELSPTFNHICLCGDVLLSNEKCNGTNWQTLNENVSNEVLAPTAAPIIP